MGVKKQTHSNNLQQLTAGTAQGKLMADEEASLGSHCIESFRGNRPRDGLQEKQGPFARFGGQLHRLCDDNKCMS